MTRLPTTEAERQDVRDLCTDELARDPDRATVRLNALSVITLLDEYEELLTTANRATRLQALMVRTVIGLTQVVASLADTKSAPELAQVITEVRKAVEALAGPRPPDRLAQELREAARTLEVTAADQRCYSVIQEIVRQACDHITCMAGNIEKNAILHE